MIIKNNIWNDVIRNLESGLTEAECKTWFSNLYLEKYENNTAFIRVPNKFIADWLFEHYIDKIKISFNRILENTTEIRFTYNRNYSLNQSHVPHANKKTKNAYFMLDTNMHFDNFIVGDCNKFAYSSARKVANNNSGQYNPLYIFSKSSLGKTHLLNAIGNKIIEKDSSCELASLSAEDYFSDFNNHLKTNSLNNFKDKYYNINLLLFDDIHALSNKKKLQEEFLSLFDFLYEAKKQIVITCDRPPNRLKHFNSHIISRLGSGLIAEINNYSNDVKLEIIKLKMNDENINIPNDIVVFLSQYTNNIKELVKIINRIKTFLSIHNGDLNLSRVKALISNDIGLKDIQSITAGYFNISVQDLISQKKGRIYSYPRQLAIYLGRTNTNLSYKDIGAYFNGRDHSTIIYAFKKIEKQIHQKKDIMRDINNLNKLLK